MPSPQDREAALFQAAAQLTGDQRTAFLEHACQGDNLLRQRLEARLAAHNQPGESPTAVTVRSTVSLDVTDTLDSAAEIVLAGTLIAGRYTLTRKLGHGGMGEVWVASQNEPVKREVALKLIRPGMDSKSVVQRFEQERQALAVMDHPNIARVIDGGLTPAGQPFFVMELVNGQPLNEFCDASKLTPKQRLELFIPICQAVQHAHQKGIVHRDLKPANILVTTVDGKAVPKVIDFGVAKATAGKLTDQSMATQYGALIGTLEYMAPEQAAGQDIDTRVDIYALGVILYELLTGLRPLDAEQLQRAGLLEMLRVIKEEEPPRPSTRLSTEGALPSLAALRQTEPRKLMGLLQGELDWVVMKCLEKQRNRRYETANGLVRDLQRYLADEPVEARPPSPGYRLQKFVRRNKVKVIAASLVLLALLAGMAGTTWGFIQSRRQEKEARRQEAIALHETAEKEKARLAEAERAEGERLAKLDAQAARDKAEQNAQIAGTQATLALNTIQSLISQTTDQLQGPGLAQIRQGLLQVALQNVNGVADIYEKSTSKEATTAAALVELGKIYRQLGQPEKAVHQFLQALEIAKERVKVKKGSDPSRRNLALVYSNLGATAEEVNRDMDAALDYQLKALALFEDIDQHPMLADSPTPRSVVRAALAESYKLVGVLYYRAGNLDEALPYFQKAYDLARESAATRPNDTATQDNLVRSELALGLVALRTGAREQGETFFSEARKSAETFLSAKPNDIPAKLLLADVLYLIGESHCFASKLSESRAAMQDSLKPYQEAAKADPQNVFYQRTLSKVLYRLGNLDLLEQKPDDARVRFEESLKLRAALGSLSKDNDRQQMDLMLAQAQGGQTDVAIATARRLETRPKVDPELRIYLARCYAAASRAQTDGETSRRQTFQASAVAALDAAAKDGYRDRGYLEGEPDFAPLRDRDDFKKLLQGLGSPSPVRK